MNNLDILNARKNIHSQNGEDGVIELLIDIFDIKEGSFCEFGAWDGRYLSNTYNLLENKNWKGVYIEGDEAKYNDLIKLKNHYGEKIQTINSYVSHEGPNKLDNLLKDTFLEKDFDLLSIDIDGMDYHVWKALEEYKPKLVIIEVDSSLKPGDMTVAKINTDNSYSSFSATCKLGIEKGYYPIIHFGNIFFGEKKFLESKNYLFPKDIDSLFNWH